MPKVHALPVGIGRYRRRMNLRGCVNDADLVELIPRDRIGPAGLAAERLCDDRATRSGLIEAPRRLGLLAARHGRNVLWSQARQISPELDALRGEHLELAGRAEQIRAGLDGATRSSAPWSAETDALISLVRNAAR
ncbi:MAG: hypothetical protein SYR96_02760 [Actinomycetota bacterium]|nr:hypothetical protein [Actinomycetota bacterium]